MQPRDHKAHQAFWRSMHTKGRKGSIKHAIDAAILHLREHIRIQALDIMTLGQQIGKLEAQIKELQNRNKPNA